MNDMSHPPAPPPDPAPGARDSRSLMSEMLTAQARSLDGFFTGLIGHAEENITKWPVAAEAYARLAFRAQWNCRTSLEALAKADRLEAARQGESR